MPKWVLPPVWERRLPLVRPSRVCRFHSVRPIAVHFLVPGRAGPASEAPRGQEVAGAVTRLGPEPRAPGHAPRLREPGGARVAPRVLARAPAARPQAEPPQVPVLPGPRVRARVQEEEPLWERKPAQLPQVPAGAPQAWRGDAPSRKRALPPPKAERTRDRPPTAARDASPPWDGCALRQPSGRSGAPDDASRDRPARATPRSCDCARP